MTFGRLVRFVAGLTGAFLVASCASGEVTVGSEPTAASQGTPLAEQVEPTRPALPTTSSTTRQVLVATNVIPRGTSQRELIETPTVYLTVKLVPEELLVAGAIGTIAELAEFTGMVLAAEVLPGEQLLRDRFREPNNFEPEVDPGGPSTAPTILVEVPAGHDIEVLVVPPNRAVGGYIRAGELIRIVGTSVGPDGQTVSTTVLDAVEVLGFESTLAAPVRMPSDYAITIAVTPDEAARLSAARAESVVITVATQKSISDGYETVVEMSQIHALEGRIRAGDVVNVVSVADTDEPDAQPLVVAGEIEVLQVSTDNDPQFVDTTFSIIVSADPDQLLALTTAIANGQVALTEP